MATKIEIPLIIKDDGSVVLGKVADKLDDVEKKGGKARGMLADFGKDLLSGVGLGAGFAATEVAANALIGTVQAIPATFLAWTSAALETADTLSNLSASSGLTAEQLQRLDRVGSSAGVSMETMAKSALELQRRLDQTPKAFAEMGVSVDRLLALEPDAALREMVQIIGQMKTPGEQAAAAQKLLGDATGQMLRVVRDGLGVVQDYGELTNDQVAKLDTLGDTTGDVETAWKNLTIQFAATVAQSPELVGMLKDLAEGLGGLAVKVRSEGQFITDTLRVFTALVTKLTPGLELARQVWTRTVRDMAANPEVRTPVFDPEKIVPPSMDAEFNRLVANAERFGVEAEKAQAKAEAAARKHLRALEDLTRAELALTQAAMSVADKEVEAWAKADAKLAEHEDAMLAAAESAEVAAMRQEFGLRELYTVVDQGSGLWTRYADVVEAEMQNAADGTQVATNAVFDLGAAIFGTMGDAITIIDALEQAFDQLGISSEHGIGQAVRGLGDLARAGQEAGKAFMSFSSGDIVGGIASGIKAIGGAISGFKNLWNGLFGNSEVMKVNDMRDAFFDARGGFEAFSREMAEVSREDWAKKIFDARTVEDFNRLVAEAEGLLEGHGRAQAELDAAMERYGFTADKTAKELDASAQDIYKHWELLTKGALIPANEVLEKMAPDIQDYIDRAREAGAAIPESLRPVVEAMIEQGKLLDENGNAFTSVEDAGLSFTQTLTEGMQSLVKSVQELIDTLRGVSTTAQDAGRAIGGIPEPPFGGDYGYPDTGRPYGSYGPSYDVGAFSVPRSGPAIVHRNETIIPSSGPALDKMAARVAAMVGAGGGGGPIQVTSHVVMDRKVVATAVATAVRDDAALRAEIVRAANGRR